MHSVDMNMDGVVSYEEFAPLCFDILVEILKDELLQVSAKPATSTTSTSTAPLILRAPRRTSPRRASPKNVRPRLTLRPDAAPPLTPALAALTPSPPAAPTLCAGRRSAPRPSWRSTWWPSSAAPTRAPLAC